MPGGDPGETMADSDDDEFRRIVEGLEPGTAAPSPKPSRESLREVKREAKQRAKQRTSRSSTTPTPELPRAWRAGPSEPRRRVSERTRTVAVLGIVALVVAGLFYVQTSLGHKDEADPAAATGPASSTAPPSSYPTPGHEAAARPLGTPPKVRDARGRYAFTAKQKTGSEPVAYDPCRPIHYVVNPVHEPNEGARLLSEAFAAVSAATGLRFVSDGTTTEPTGFDRETFQPARYGDRWAPVLITWPTGSEQPDFVGQNIGEAGSAYVNVDLGPRVYVTGEAQFDSDWFIRTLSQPKGYARAESVVLHELGHLVGLAHVTDRSQIMFAMETPSVTRYAAGDLAGLARLGAGACEPRL
jgi:hypothetical protein